MKLVGIEGFHQVLLSPHPDIKLLAHQRRVIPLGDILQCNLLHCQLPRYQLGKGKRHSGVPALLSPGSDARRELDGEGIGGIAQNILQFNGSQGDGTGQSFLALLGHHGDGFRGNRHLHILPGSAAALDDLHREREGDHLPDRDGDLHRLRTGGHILPAGGGSVRAHEYHTGLLHYGIPNLFSPHRCQGIGDALQLLCRAL